MELLRQKIKEAGLTQAEFAERSGISPHTLTKWLNGYTRPSKAGLEKLGEFFCIPYEAFAEDFGVMDRLLDDRSDNLKKPEKEPEKAQTQPQEKTVKREEYIVAAKRSMEKLSTLVGDSKIAMIAAELLKADIERRLW